MTLHPDFWKKAKLLHLKIQEEAPKIFFAYSPIHYC